jgi:hypothetical protein
MPKTRKRDRERGTHRERAHLLELEPAAVADKERPDEQREGAKEATTAFP